MRTPIRLRDWIFAPILIFLGIVIPGLCAQDSGPRHRKRNQERNPNPMPEPSVEPEPIPDVVERAKAALEGMPPSPWQFDPNQDDLLTDGNGHVILPSVRATEFIAAARTLVPELVTEVERLRELYQRVRLQAEELRSGR